MSATEGAATAAIAASGLIEPGSSGVVLLSGGPDSVSLLAGLVAYSPDPPPVAQHINYGLRPESDDDQAVCVEVCRRLGIELVVEPAGEPDGNLQAWARDLRYAAAERLRAERGADWIAVGHTKSDVAETVVYRLASSRGRRALAAMAPRRGKVVRPILELNRQETRACAKASGLPFADDASNRDPAFSRVRIRSEVMPVLRDINPAAETNILRTRSELLEEGELLDNLAGELLEAARLDTDRLDGRVLAAAHPALRRLALRQFAEDRLGHPVHVSGDVAAGAVRLAADPEGGQVDLGGGAFLLAAAGAVSVSRGIGTGLVPAESMLRLPGKTEWGGWALKAEELAAPFVPAAPEAAAIDLNRSGRHLTVREWRPGDRIRPLGMDGSKTLQDLFTDSRVPRTQRHRIPVLLSGDEVVWVAGLTIGHRYRLTAQTTAAVLVTATPPAAASQA